jgi:hypothetical protein
MHPAGSPIKQRTAETTCAMVAHHPCSRQFSWAITVGAMTRSG